MNYRLVILHLGRESLCVFPSVVVPVVQTLNVGPTVFGYEILDNR